MLSDKISPTAGQQPGFIEFLNEGIMKKRQLSNLSVPFLFIFCLLCNNSNVLADCKYDRHIEAEPIAVGVLLNWSTSQEKNSSMFIVEKSTDGMQFANLGAIKAAGESAHPKAYSFLDISAGAERVFYRLRQINVSGTYSFSDVLTVHKETSNYFMVTRMSSIAAKDYFEVNIDSRLDSQLSYSLLDWKGNELQTEVMPLMVGQNRVKVDLTGLPAAIYRLELQAEGEVETLTFEKISKDKEADGFVKKDHKTRE